MATFYVGQRVRIKWSRNWPELDGTEGVIVGRETCTDQDTGKILEWEVAPDAWGDSLEPGGFRSFAPNSDQLEPIQYDGNKVIKWSECLWQPEHIRTAA